MRPTLGALVLSLTYLLTPPAVADEQTVKLKIDNMFCPTCPFMVKRTLSKVDGVKNVDISFRQKMATVTYDDQRCSIAELAGAVTQAGFPATPVDR